MKKNICVLEDNEDIREIIEMILQQEEYLVFSYATIAAFRKRQEAEKPDIFILDVMLPDGNGMEVCNELKSDQQTNTIPVLIMSAHANMTSMRRECKAEDFISKPFDIYDFVKRIDTFVGASH